MKNVRKTRLALSWLIAASTLSWHPAARAQAQIFDLLWPVFIVVQPIVQPVRLVHELLFGSDQGASKAREEESRAILADIKQPMVTNGVYIHVHEANLESPIHGLLVERKMPFIEIDAEDALWLQPMLAEPADASKAMTQRPHVRISLAGSDDPFCLKFRRYGMRWLDQPPVRPGTCMKAEPVDALDSRLEVRLGTSQVGKRMLRWEVWDRARAQKLTVIPFWETQSEGAPIRVTMFYESRQSSGVFAQLASKLAPDVLPRRSDGQVPVLSWMQARASRPIGWVSKESQVMAQVSLASDQSFLRTESWADGYARARETGRPTLVGDSILLKPDEDSVATGFAGTHGVSDIWLVSGDVKMNNDQFMRMLKSAGKEQPEWTEVMPHVTGYDFAGKLHFNVRLQPDRLPDETEACKGEKVSRCEFRIRDIKLTADALLVNCWFVRQGQFRHVYEWRVPMTALPLQEIKSPV